MVNLKVGCIWCVLVKRIRHSGFPAVVERPFEKMGDHA